MTNYVVFDLETTGKNKGEDAIGDFSASPFHPDNYIVCAGISATDCGTEIINTTNLNKGFTWLFTFGEQQEKSFPMLVGHNIKFDLHYMMKTYPNFQTEIMPHISIWDTQLAEYLLTGQQSKWADLNSLSEKYGGTLKDDRIKAFWDSGVPTENIPQDILHEYCKNDVENTEIVFKNQMIKAKELGMFPLIISQMDALLATIEMEWNGMCFDKALAQKYKEKQKKDLDEVKEKLEAYMQAAIMNSNIVVNPDSKDQLSAVLFGGFLEYKEKELVLDEQGNGILIKSGTNKGQPKTKYITKKQDVLGMFKPKPEWATKKSGVYSTSDEVIDELIATNPPTRLFELIKDYRSLSKDVGTYYDGYMKLVWPKGFIHGKLNMVQTNTGRLSSSQPNLQNLSGED